MSTTVYYDGDCPFCSRYVKMMRLQKAAGQVELVDVRSDADRRATLEAEGFDLDQGMVVDQDGRRVGGADATNLLALMTTPSDLFNRLNRLVFAVPAISAVLYPALRSGRWITLFFLGRESLADAGAEVSTRQMLFSFFFSLFSLIHVFNYAFAYDRAPDADLIAVFAAAMFLLWKPGSPRALFLLMAASLISTIAQAPAQSNHTMLRSMLVLGYFMSFGWAMLRSRPVADVFGNFILAGRWSLLVMYVFGIFHKINTDFLNPDTSCAMVLWRAMPWPLHTIQGPVMEFLAIYGTFAVEGAIMLALIWRPTRYLGLVAGILFHIMLGLSDYAAYVAFTTLSIACHVLWLDRRQVSRMVGSSEMSFIQTRLHTPAGLGLLIICLTGAALAMWRHDFSLSNLFLLPFVLPLCWLILRYGREDKSSGMRHGAAAITIGVLAAGVYFISASMPYLGLKTAQSINMFANLRLEAGVSNHVVFPNPPSAFGYLDDVATITEASGAPFLEDYQKRGFAIVYYDLLAHLADNPDVSVSYQMNEQNFADISAADVQGDIDAMVHHPWLRKWFHFQPVQLDQPEACSL